MTEERIRLEEDRDVVAAWKSGLALGRKLGFGLFKQACLSGAILQLTRSVVEKGRKGSCVIADESDAKALRARVVIEGCAGELVDAAKSRINAELNVGPALPAVKLHQVLETCRIEPQGDGVRISLTINQPRGALKAPGRPSPAGQRQR